MLPLMIAWAAVVLGKRARSQRYSRSFGRATILAGSPLRASELS